MKNKVLKTLAFFRLLDEAGQLSITNIAVILVLIKLGLTKTVDLGSAATLLTVISSYHFKRYLGGLVQDPAPKDEVNDLRSQLNQIKLKLGIGQR